MSDLSRLLDDVYGSATVTSMTSTSTATRTAVATAPTAPTPVALPDPAPLPPADPDPAELLDSFFDLGPIEPDTDDGHEEGLPDEQSSSSAARWQPGDDDILPARGSRRLGLRLRRG